MANPTQSARSLSGGNQQKVVLAKWLESQSEIIIFDEPTRGIDVGAKFEIYQLMKDLARRGKSILMVTSELTEVLGMADRILSCMKVESRAKFEMCLGQHRLKSWNWPYVRG